MSVQAVDLAIGNVLINFPGQHSNMIAGRTWKEEVEHVNEGAAANCNSKISGTYRQCYLAFSEGKVFSGGIASVRLSIKTKAWTKNVEFQYDSYALIYA